MFGKYRIKSKVRFTIFISLLVILIFTVATAILGYSNVSGVEESQYKTIVVEPGDTLWNIAKVHCDDNNKDIRKTIYEIENINDLDNQYIQPGQELIIPVN